MGAQSIPSDDEYDFISNPGQMSLESSIAELGFFSVSQAASEVYEPPPSEAAKEQFETVNWSAKNIQDFVQEATSKQASGPLSKSPEGRTVRVYVDGAFDAFNAGHALQLRQAKLSFPSVYLLVGVFSDRFLKSRGVSTSIPHVERCEVVRHCRWVDEVVADAPYRIDESLLWMSVDPTCDKERLKGYDNLREFGKVIPTRRTLGLATPSLRREPAPSTSAVQQLCNSSLEHDGDIE
ncbi:hypothetical protein BD779DRAFT_1610243 [Infundibulicybe gibba]|nr:hypothetical protein BD779DRAFT_1610243 [Infundibulicybe gibba]